MRENKKPELVIPITKVDSPLQRVIALRRGWIRSRRPGSNAIIDLRDPRNGPLRKLYTLHGAVWDSEGYFNILRPLASHFHFVYRVMQGQEAFRQMGRLENMAELFKEAEREAL